MAMSNSLPEELQQRCVKITDIDAQGTQLAVSDYALFAVVTVFVPAVLIAIGALL